MKVGDRVRIERTQPAIGTWSRYAGKPGIVAVVGKDEIGVDVGTVHPRFDGEGRLQYNGLVWFRPDELRGAPQPC